MRSSQVILFILWATLSPHVAQAESGAKLPANGTLRIESWSTQDPEFKVSHTLSIRKGKVTGTSSATLTTPDGSCTPLTFSGSFQGRLQGDTISGEEQIHTNAVTCSQGGCVTVIRYETTLPERRIVLNSDGSLTGIVRGSRSMRTVTTSGCSDPDNIRKLRSANDQPAEFLGTWQMLRK